MRIAFVVWEFPVLSQTFVINQITGLIDRGYTVDIYAHIRGDLSKMHPDVEQYHLLDHTYYAPPIPANKIKRVVKGISLLCRTFLKHPVRLYQSFNVFKYGLRVVSLRLAYAITPLLDKQPYDIIHAQFGTDGLNAMFLRSVGAIQGKLITVFRGYDISTFVKAKGEQVYDQLFQQGDFFLTNCEFFRQRAIQLGCNPDKIVVHGSGIDCSRFVFAPRKLSWDGVVRISTTGRLVEKKGIEYSIRAVAQLLPIHPNIEYTIIGDGPLRPQFEQLIQELGVGDRIKLVGQKQQQEIIEILGQSHLFVAPSVTAQDGNQDAPINVLKEAMAMGLPIVSTYHGGIPELVQDNVSGFLVPERDVGALAEKISTLMAHSERWQEMGKAGRAYVEAHYDINTLNDRLVEIYQRMIQHQDYQSLKSEPRLKLESV